MSETPYKVNIPNDELESLRRRLELTRFPDELDEAGWQYGVPLADAKRLVERWKSGFDWRAREAEINKLPQFTRDIEVEGFGILNIHYVHQKSKVDGAVPLLFIHGWPGHFLEVEKILPLLISHSADHPSFHVVSLSLPGTGFSDAPKRKGFSIPQYAEVGHKLMLALGYDDNTPPRFLSEPLLYLKYLVTPYTERDKAGFARGEWFSRVGAGYYIEQSTQPQTIGYSLSDSPLGLLAWIYEKLVQWTDNYPWTDDEVLQWVSIYWFSKAGPAASVRVYYESQANGHRKDVEATTVPMGISRFPKELRQVPKTWTHKMGNVVFDAEHDSGGHFPAYEAPAALVGDLRKMFGKGGPAFGVVNGKNGYATA
ncbi:hypothetical protein NLI96_g11707 [Meripilus lineatus]|uniref:Epoxide hydrolase N-terminal domain-containing protein n=1 Tax=Meripilus lineatus TaxID=2056292 RepID=A0AAD5UVC6_9APHY|nr:hypothetical protein NLI96_g11707 [Physisporinus lineatus]